jgi:hypothetical protein
MNPLAIEKLKKDSRKLDHNIQRMRKRGRSDLAGRLMNKKAQIDMYIEQFIDDDRHPHYESKDYTYVPYNYRH